MPARTPEPSFSATMEHKTRIAGLRARIDEGQVRASVIGAGRSGLAALSLLQKLGISSSVQDDRPKDELLAKVPQLAGVSVGSISAAECDAVDLVVLSPGVPRARPELRSSIARGALIGEIELASWFVQIPIVAITGTNGKSTTTALVGHILERAGVPVFVGGNLGRPLSELVVSEEPAEVAVVELSSYQLESIVTVRFAVGCWLNLTPDHTDRYESLDWYAAAKRQVVEARSVNGAAVLNAKDPSCAEVGVRLGGRVRWFAASSTSDLATASGTRLDGVSGAIRTEGGEEERYDLQNPALIGRHNRANMLAAIECARHLEIPAEVVADGLASFVGLPHRLELVAEKQGVRWYNDSKATNVESAKTALEAIEAPTILIAGGRDKGAPWGPLVEAAEQNVKLVLAVGEAADVVVSAFSRGRTPVEIVGDLETAVRRATEVARAGDVVVLSPACASFDQFENYEVRGDFFRGLVGGLGGGS